MRSSQISRKKVPAMDAMDVPSVDVMIVCRRLWSQDTALDALDVVSPPFNPCKSDDTTEIAYRSPRLESNVTTHS